MTDSLLEKLGGNSKDYGNNRYAKELETDLAVDKSELEEIGVDTQETQQAAKLDLNFLAALCMPTIFKFMFPPPAASLRPP